MKPKSKETQHDICNKQVQDLIDISESKNDWKPGSISMVTFEEKKSMYDSVLKKRLNCGSRLETLSKEIGKKNPRTTLSRETTMKYAELKTEYLKFCYQEAALRHQIAILQAEIYMMQNKGFHKRPATIKTITLDSKSTNLPVRQEMTSEVSRDTEFDHVPLLPRLKPPKPLLLLPSPNSDKTPEKTKPKRESRRIGSLSSSEADVMLLLPSLTGTPALRGICSVYNLTTELEPPLKKRQPDVLLKPATPGVKIVHRLPKMCRILQL
ncbi:uncharacterized protein LOC127870970 [Dreissena polymorpha]|uniref:uncharacterized protein LOC127870970 n=1 Tax=Dreissena polymorpha TaxID=45954 RepID=UPI002264B756|nr:uncharacterized protein LOC127870970 [Dreissena polymorpha]